MDTGSLFHADEARAQNTALRSHATVLHFDSVNTAAILRFLIADANAAFFVGTSSAIIAANTTDITFEKAFVDTQNSLYSAVTKTVSSVPLNGVYWFQLAAGVPAGIATGITLNGLPYPLVITTTNTAFSDDVIVADTIQYVSTSAVMTVFNTAQVFGTLK